MYMTLEPDEVLQSRIRRVQEAQHALRNAVMALSSQVNDEQMLGGALTGLLVAEQSARDALYALSGLDDARDVRRR